MKRVINKQLVVMLEEICTSPDDSPMFWKEFYNWCIISYRNDRINRFSISELGEFLLKRNIENAQEIIVAYIHVLYSLAMFEGDEIYGEGFII
ncbi:hypothetical protein GZH82_10280 [Staphylococcus ursi]|uniref:hypothetical protein n=1 Tax=Staphylococcus TaxID=1279 RepID=UPI00139833FF|nr:MULTISPECIES: hypothetical protein [Staphylococcus]MDE9829158.1 hypothetical protein [Staphylococcus delphini]QHW37697.1 hypothetical protein GZH82_10280 [Staphylococcus sp. MI 10-1553]